MTEDADGPPEHQRDPRAELWCDRLDLGPPSLVRELRSGRSGSLVLALRAGGEHLVVKVTCDSDRLARAELEARLLASGVLAGLAAPIVASATGDGWVAIALQPCTPLEPVERIDRSTWIQIADGLAVIHSTDLEGADLKGADLKGADLKGAGAALGAAGRPTTPTPTHDPCVPSETTLLPWFAIGGEEAARRGVDRLARAGPLLWPLVLEHGDSHVENILRTREGALVWIDWQEAHLGDGLSDLVFGWQRAEFAGAGPPRRQMTDAYAAARGLDAQQLQPRIDEVELRLLLASWPPFLDYGTADAQRRMLRRLTTLVEA